MKRNSENHRLCESNCGLFGFLLSGERVVKPGHTFLKLVHHQRPVLVKEHRHRLGDLSFPPTLGLPVGKGNPECVLVIESDKKHQEELWVSDQLIMV